MSLARRIALVGAVISVSIAAVPVAAQATDAPMFAFANTPNTPPSSGCVRGQVEYWTYFDKFQAGGACQASPDGRHFVIFQTDGNFVVYNSTTSANRAIWQSGTAGRGTTLTFEPAGVINIRNYNSSNYPIWSNNVNSGYTYYKAVMQNDGNFVEYGYVPNGPIQALWSTGTAGR